MLLVLLLPLAQTALVEPLLPPPSVPISITLGPAADTESETGQSVCQALLFPEKVQRRDEHTHSCACKSATS